MTGGTTNGFIASVLNRLDTVERLIELHKGALDDLHDVYMSLTDAITLINENVQLLAERL